MNNIEPMTQEELIILYIHDLITIEQYEKACKKIEYEVEQAEINKGVEE